MDISGQKRQFYPLYSYHQTFINQNGNISYWFDKVVSKNKITLKLPDYSCLKAKLYFTLAQVCKGVISLTYRFISYIYFCRFHKE